MVAASGSFAYSNEPEKRSKNRQTRSTNEQLPYAAVTDNNARQNTSLTERSTKRRRANLWPPSSPSDARYMPHRMHHLIKGASSKKK